MCKDICIGHTYNGLTVERYLGVINKRSLWEVRCHCGELKSPMRKDNILKSKGKCVCRKTEEGYFDLTGQKFNKLEVISLDKIDNKRSYWNVRCDCGRVYSTRGDVLKKNKDGCGRHIRPHVYNGDGTVTVDVSTSTHKNVHTLVDEEDFYEYMRDTGWWALKHPESSDYYVQGFYKGKQCCIHQLISGSYFIEDGVTDHISGNTLDNRKCNLRITDMQGNAKNRRVPRNNSSGYQGISELANGKFRTYVTVDGIQKFLGTYENIEDAIEARKHGLNIYDFHENHDRY